MHKPRKLFDLQLFEKVISNMHKRSVVAAKSVNALCLMTVHVVALRSFEHISVSRNERFTANTIFGILALAVRYQGSVRDEF